jgi:hypothetical protein
MEGWKKEGRERESSEPDDVVDAEDLEVEEGVRNVASFDLGNSFGTE